MLGDPLIESNEVTISSQADQMAAAFDLLMEDDGASEIEREMLRTGYMAGMTYVLAVHMEGRIEDAARRLLALHRRYGEKEDS